jgi:ankyrin repeat protein
LKEDMTEELRKRFLSRDVDVLDRNIEGMIIFGDIRLRPRCRICGTEEVLVTIPKWKSLIGLTGECRNCQRYVGVEVVFFDRCQTVVAISRPGMGEVELLNTLCQVACYKAQPLVYQVDGIRIPQTDTTSCSCCLVKRVEGKMGSLDETVCPAHFPKQISTSETKCRSCSDNKQSLHQNIIDGNMAAIVQQVTRDDIEKIVNCGMTGLYFAALKGKPEVVKFYLKRGADVNGKSRKGGSPLHAAVTSKCSEVVEILLSAGAKVDQLDDDESTPFLIACSEASIDIVICSLLLKAGTNIHAVTQFKETPLHLFARTGRVDIIRLLIDAKAEVDPSNNFGRTPLAQAIYFGQEAAGKMLLAKGAKRAKIRPDIRIPDWAGGEHARTFETKDLRIKQLEEELEKRNKSLEDSQKKIEQLTQDLIASANQAKELKETDEMNTTLARKVFSLSTQVEFQLRRGNEAEERLQEVTASFSTLKVILDRMRAEREPKHFMDQ